MSKNIFLSIEGFFFFDRGGEGSSLYHMYNLVLCSDLCTMSIQGFFFLGGVGGWGWRTSSFIIYIYIYIERERERERKREIAQKNHLQLHILLCIQCPLLRLKA